MTLSKVREERQGEVGGRLADGERGLGACSALSSQILTAGSLPGGLSGKAEQSPPVPSKEPARPKACQNFQQSSGVPPAGSVLPTQTKLFSHASQDLWGQEPATEEGRIIFQP